MTLNPSVSRRSVLVAGVAGAGAVTLAACGSSSSPASAGGGNAGGSSNTGTSGTKAASGAGTVLGLDAVKVGASASATIDGKPVCVFRESATSVVCHTAICTHQGCTVKPDGAKLVCPCHGSEYNAKTGAVLQGPATQPLAPISVKVDGKNIVTG